MKTVQEAFCEIDDDTLIEAYLYHFPIHINPNEKSDYDTMTIGEYKKSIQEDLKQYLHRLRTLPTKKSSDGKLWIFFVERSFDQDGFIDFKASLVNEGDLRKKGVNAPNYAYEYIDQSEVLGYYVADNIHTQKHLDDLLAEIMYELNFFGYNQEELPEAKKELDEATTEAKVGKVKSFKSIDEFMKEFDYDFESDKYTDKEEELNSARIAANNKLITYSRKLEVDQILKDLDKTKEN